MIHLLVIVRHEGLRAIAEELAKAERVGADGGEGGGGEVAQIVLEGDGVLADGRDSGGGYRSDALLERCQFRFDVFQLAGQFIRNFFQ